MSKTLILAEKPSVGRDIARVLNCNKNLKGYIEGNDYIVTWALGHLVTLADPESYDKKYKSWNLEDLPILPNEAKLVVIGQTSKQFNTVKSQMLRKDVDKIVIATDAGREGELVARWIIEKLKLKKPIQRLWISSVTDRAILDGFKNLKDGRHYEKLYEAAQARAEADWVVGINATRALTVKYNSQLSCGRVQTPTLAMIAGREEEVKRFRPRDYYGIEVTTKDMRLTWKDKNSNSRSFNKGFINSIMQTIENKDGRITSLTKLHKKIKSPGLYDLTELQRDANRLFDFSAKETLAIMQSLYERHKLLTYPRTDSRYLSDDLLDTLEDRLRAISMDTYRKYANYILSNPIIPNKSFVDNKKVTDHHAIIPTDERPRLADLNNGERKIYDLVVKRFLAVLYKPFEYEETRIEAEIEKERFTDKGKRIISAGWKDIYSNLDLGKQDEEEDTEDQSLPSINKGDMFKVSSVKETLGQTKPPAYFNEASLLTAMENPGSYIEGDNKKMAKILDQVGGIGTVATRADIIEKLFNSFLIEKNGKAINLTGKGKQLLELVPEDLKSPILTGRWEEKLGLIEKGRLSRIEFIEEMKDYSRSIVKEIKGSEKTFQHDNLTRTKCPECGKYMLEVKTKNGKSYVCQDRECNHRISIAQRSNARCPNCRKRLELRGQGESRIFTCVCGYREKLSSFNERRKKEQNKLNRREVSKYLKDQNKDEESLNTSLADALSKLKL